MKKSDHTISLISHTQLLQGNFKSLMGSTLGKINLKYKAKNKPKQNQVNLRIFVEFRSKTLLNSD